MNDREYNALDGIRRSDLWVIKQSPMHFKYHMDHPETDSPSLTFGRAMHKYILEPETFNEEFAIAPIVDRRTKDGKLEYADFLNTLGDRDVITFEDIERIGDMKRSLMQNSEVVDIMQNIISVETPFVWTDAKTGERCKVKTDMIVDINGMPYIVDYKTTTSCADGAFERSVRKYGYDFQSGMYSEGVEITTLEAHGFIFIAQEKDAPYASRVYYCDEYFVEKGQREFHDLLEIYHDCKQTGNWYGYETRELYAEDWN